MNLTVGTYISLLTSPCSQTATTESSSDHTLAIIGGVVAVVGVIIIAITVAVVALALILKNCYRHSSTNE